MPKIIDLIETSPGEWRFVKRLRLAWDKRFKQDAEARRERFFESLAGVAIKPKPDRWWTGGVGVLLIVAAATILLLVMGWPDVAFLPLFAAFLVGLMRVVIDLCHGESLSTALRSLIKP